MSFSQVKATPKLLLQFHRNQQVPKLVSINEVVKKDYNRNKLLQQARNIATQPKRQGGAQNAYLKQTLERERSENQELRSAVKELTIQLQKLRQVNQGLFVRIKQVQSSYRTLRGNLEQKNQEERRRSKNAIYSEVEEYLKISVQKLTMSLKQERMTPVLQQKLERFMAEIMEINAVSVEQLVRKTHRQNSRVQDFHTLKSLTENGKLSNVIADKYVNDLSNSKNSVQNNRAQYASIMQRLAGETRMSKSFAGNGLGSYSQDVHFRNVYATTPHKRRKIFD